MKKINIKILSVLLVGLMLMCVFSTSIYAPGNDGQNTNTQNSTNQYNNTQNNSALAGNLGNFLTGGNNSGYLLGNLTNVATDLVEKIVGPSPIIHGVLAGAVSGFKTYKNVKDTKFEFVLTKDLVNISNDKLDYIDDPNYANYAADFYLQRIMSPNDPNYNTYETDTLPFETITITDKNILDTEFIQTVDLTSLDRSNSPTFRLEETTEEYTTYDLNNNVTSAQKRGILFEDPNKTVGNDYEYRFLVAKYPKLLFDEEEIYINLKFDMIKDDLGWANLYFMPFYSVTSALRLDKILDGKTLAKELQDLAEVKEEKQAFHLVFNSWTVDTDSTLELEELDCVDGGMALGTTGEESLPRVAFDWDFDTGSTTAINGMQLEKDTWCDVDSTGETDTGMYCDATQFNIEILNKLNELEEYVLLNSSEFTCPMPGVTQDLEVQTENVGITSLNSEYDSLSLVDVEYTLESYYDFSGITPSSESKVTLTLSLKNSNSVILDSEEIVLSRDELSLENISGEVSLNAGYFADPEKLTVTASLSNFTSDLNSEYNEPRSLDNFLENIFSTEGVECSLEHTSENIKDFARELNNFDYEKLVNFRSLLMLDGYSTDFLEDFDEYYRMTFMAYPSYYYDDTTEEGLYKLLLDHDKFAYTSSFDSETGKLVLPGPGRYEVLVDVTFDDQWRIFDDFGNIVGDVEIVLSKEMPPERDAPIYYMPFDGLVGVLSENARQGYGIDYIGDVLEVYNDGQATIIRSEPFTASNTVNTVSFEEIGNRPGDFSKLNNNQTRGQILSVQTNSSHSAPEVRFAPSRATPVVMKVTNTNNDAYAFYKLSVGAPEDQGGEAASPGSYLTKWTGIGECKDFTGISVQEIFIDRADILATQSELAPYTPSQNFTYGVEWPEDEIIRKNGSVFLKTILYTPSNSPLGNGVSQLVADSYSDDLMFYTNSGNGTVVDLENIYSNDIQTIKDIYDMIAQKKACVNYSSTSMNVYYNPKFVYEEYFGNLDSENMNSWIEQNGGCIID